MGDPFKIDGPTCFSFSTGRSSGYALRRTLDANEPEVMHEHLKVLTCNTGKEDEASLRFGDRVDREWLRPLGLSLTWLEYRPGAEFTVMDFDGLSRSGEPFEAVIAQRGGTLPNPRSRYCSSELKTRTMHRYLRSIGWEEWETMIGVRADEQRRVAKFRFNPHPETKAEFVRIPLADAFVTAEEVGDFWRRQPFDLELPNNNGKTMHGNCDLCFLKPAAQVFSLIAEKPERAAWWAKQEALGRAHGDGRFFRNDRPSYAEMAQYAAKQQDIFDQDEEAISCFCGD
jgi:3'-phosphoadenosine 5'-phosphosulfate sulfotransferase (PAPS reductase)/FAD synthetase